MPQSKNLLTLCLVCAVRILVSGFMYRKETISFYFKKSAETGIKSSKQCCKYFFESKNEYILFQCGMSLVMLCSSDVYTLINYTSFVESSFIGISVAGLLYLRYKCPDLHRPIKVRLKHTHNTLVSSR